MAPRTKEQTKEYIAALLYERDGYVRYGNQAGVEAVDAELERVGHKAKPPAKRATKMEQRKSEL